MNSSLRSRCSSLLAVALAAAVIAVTLTVVASAPAEARGLNLHRGSHGTKVRVLETRLHRLDLLRASAVDRRYRRATVRSVKRFQRRNHLRVTGRVNQRTWNLVAIRARSSTPPPKPRPTGPPPAIVGHRGAVGPNVPENTMVAMREGASSADVLEFDLRVTADHQLVLMHDGTLDRTTNCRGRVIDRTLQDLRTSCHSDGQAIPTFEEVAAYAASTSLEIAPEIKNNGIEDADLGRLLETIDAHGLGSRTIMQSLTATVLERVHALRPAMRLTLVSTQPMTVAAARDVGATSVAVRMRNLTSSQVSLYRRNGLKVWTYTAIDRPTLEQARRLGVDAVVTDVPRLARSHYGV